jgi:uncharacterized protein YaaN involved in tellurite resistance
LRKTVEQLDPARNGKLTGSKKLLGHHSVRLQVENYFRQYQSAQTHISAILARLPRARTSS